MIIISKMNKDPTIFLNDSPFQNPPSQNKLSRRGSTSSKQSIVSECLIGQDVYKDTTEFAQDVDFLMGKVDSIQYEFS